MVENKSNDVYSLEVIPKSLIYIADDDRELVDLFSSILGADGHEIRRFYNGADLITELTASDRFDGVRTAPDLVISDHHMPFSTGLEALRELRELVGPLPFILISAFVDDELRQAVARLEAVCVLSKPCSVADLRQAVRTLLEGSATSMIPPAPS